MKITGYLGVSLCLIAFTTLSPMVRAAEVVKADNSTNLGNSGSWIGGTQPGATDIAVWDSTVATATSANMGAARTWGQIKVTTLVNAFTIGTGGLTLNGVSGVGIDMSAATADFTLNNPITLGADQSWIIGSGRTLTLGGALTTGGFAVSLQGAGSFVKTSTSAMSLSAGSFSGNLTNTSGTITKTGAGDLNLAGNLSTGGAVTVSGGSLTLRGANTISGNVTVDTGATLNINSANALGNSTLVLNAGSTIDNTSGGAITVANNNAWTLSTFTFGGTNNLRLGNGAVSLSTNRTVTLAGTARLTLGGQMINGGADNNKTLTVNGAGNTLELAGGIAIAALADSRTITITGDGNIEVSGAIVNGGTASASNLTYSGTGVLTLSGTNSYGGVTTVSSGTLAITTAQNTTGNTSIANANVVLGNAGALGSGTIVTTNNNAQLAASTTLTGVNAVSNAISLGSNMRIGTGSALELSGSVNMNGVARSITSNNTSNETTFSGVISNDGGGGLTLVTTGGITLSGNNTYTGATEFRGTNALSVSQIGNSGVAGNLGAGDTLRFGSNSGTRATFRYTGTGETTNRTLAFNTTVGDISIEQAGTGLLRFSGTTNTTANGAKTLFLRGSTAGTGQIDGVLADSADGALSLTKTGTGTWTLAGNNTYTGATTVSEGKLNINGSTAAGSAVTVASGGTLGGSGTIGGSVTVASGGTLSPGNSPGLLTIGGGLTLDSGSAIVMELNGTTRGTLYDAINVTGALAYGGSLTLNFGALSEAGNSYNLFDFGSQNGVFQGITLAGQYAGSFTNNSGVWTYDDNSLLFTFTQSTGVLNVSTSVIPEPSTYGVLIAAGLLAFAIFRRRRVVSVS